MFRKEHPILAAIYESSTLKTAGIVMSVMGAYMTAHTMISQSLDQQSPVITTENGRQIVRGPSYEIMQAEIDPTIVSVLKKDPVGIIDGLQRGEATLYRLCGPSLPIHRDGGRSVHVKVTNATACLSS